VSLEVTPAVPDSQRSSVFRDEKRLKSCKVSTHSHLRE
jgi:hypothetical protein